MKMNGVADRLTQLRDEIISVIGLLESDDAPNREAIKRLSAVANDLGNRATLAQNWELQAEINGYAPGQEEATEGE